jgi:hypothetical protein
MRRAVTVLRLPLRRLQSSGGAALGTPQANEVSTEPSSSPPAAQRGLLHSLWLKAADYSQARFTRKQQRLAQRHSEAAELYGKGNFILTLPKFETPRLSAEQVASRVDEVCGRPGDPERCWYDLAVAHQEGQTAMVDGRLYSRRDALIRVCEINDLHVKALVALICLMDRDPADIVDICGVSYTKRQLCLRVLEVEIKLPAVFVHLADLLRPREFGVPAETIAVRAMSTFCDARMLLEKAINLDRGYHVAYNNYGCLMDEEGEFFHLPSECAQKRYRYDRIGAFAKAVELSPQCAVYWQNLATAVEEDESWNGLPANVVINGKRMAYAEIRARAQDLQQGGKEGAPAS